jgi:bifunctional non-homologous end joining protein LigD
LQTKNFAASVAKRLTAAYPDLVIADRRSTARDGKVLIDWRQNDTYGSLVAPYSVRVARVPTVSMPIGWDEVRAVAGSNDPSSLFFLPEDVGGPAQEER